MHIKTATIVGLLSTATLSVAVPLNRRQNFGAEDCDDDGPGGGGLQGEGNAAYPPGYSSGGAVPGGGLGAAGQTPGWGSNSVDDDADPFKGKGWGEGPGGSRPGAGSDDYHPKGYDNKRWEKYDPEPYDPEGYDKATEKYDPKPYDPKGYKGHGKRDERPPKSQYGGYPAVPDPDPPKDRKGGWATRYLPNVGGLGE